MKKKKTITLKSITNKEGESDESHEGDEEYDMALVARKFKRFMRRKRHSFKK